MAMESLLCLLVLVAISPWQTYGYSRFQNGIPNGDKVLDHCDGVTVWQGVGHEAIGGEGARNLFGLHFYNNGMVWNATICQKDSDGDGMPNGAEIGDPTCVWTPGSTPTNISTGHANLCEPMSDSTCSEKNIFNTCQKSRDRRQRTN